MTVKTFTAEQELAYQAARAGHNMLVIGFAGTGKSELIRRIKSSNGGAIVTAYTGIAARNVDGMTLTRFMRDKGLIQITRTLIIDEVSMVSSAELGKLDMLAKSVRNCDAPFGGLQVILVGDPAQLAPIVSEGYDWLAVRTLYGNVQYFHGASKLLASFQLHELRTVHRL